MMWNKTIQLWLVTVIPRVVMAVAYIVVSICLINRIANSSGGVVATQALHTNHVITRDDVQTPETAVLVGKFLHQEVEAGKPVSPGMVGTRRVPPKIAPASVAVIVRLPQARIQQRSIQEGSSVTLTAGANALTGKVEKIDCDAQQCAVFVSLAGKPPQNIDAQALASADIELEPPPLP